MKNKKVVIDCCFYLKGSFKHEKIQEIRDLLIRVENKEIHAIFPNLFPYEVMNALFSNRSKMEPEVFSEVFNLCVLPFEDYEYSDIIEPSKLLNLGTKHKLTAYDTAYLELALEYSAVLCSFDKALIKAAKAEGVTVWEPGCIL